MSERNQSLKHGNEIMTKSVEKTIVDCKKEIVEFFVSANEPKTFRSKNMNQAMFELLWDKKIVPLSPTLWMATSEAKKECFA